MSMLMRWDPYRDLMEMRRAVDRLFEDVLAPRSIFDWPLVTTDLSLWRWGDNLPVDVYETEDDLVVRAAVPGVDADDIEIEERDGVLTIRAQAREEDERHEYGWHIRECHFGAWQRSLRLPVEVKADKAKAELVDGILTITLPKAHAGTPLVHRIKVSRILPKIKLPKIGKKEKGIPVTER